MRKKSAGDVAKKSSRKNSDSIETKYFYISPLRLAFMNIFTVNLYSCYWFYRNWKYVKERDGLDISPLGRCLFSPLYCHSLFKQIHDDKELNKVEKATFNAMAWATGWVFLMVTVNALRSLSQIAGPWPYVSLVRLCIHFSLFLFLLPVQAYINQVNESLDPKPSYCRWSWGQTVIFILGFLAFAGVLSQAIEGK